MKFYVIEHDYYRSITNYQTPVIIRTYYTSSNSKDVDPSDIHFAKLFPNMKSVKAALQWASTNPKVYEVDVDISKGMQVK